MQFRALKNLKIPLHLPLLWTFLGMPDIVVLPQSLEAASTVNVRAREQVLMNGTLVTV